MVEINVREGMDEAAVRPFLDAQWLSIDAEPWTGGRCVIAAERDGALVGVAACTCSAGVAHLSELMVVAEERDHGIGARLLVAFEQWAATHRAHKYTLNTRRGGPAQRFYERHGWRVAHVLTNHYLRHDYVTMEKEPGNSVLGT